RVHPHRGPVHRRRRRLQPRKSHGHTQDGHSCHHSVDDPAQLLLSHHRFWALNIHSCSLWGSALRIPRRLAPNYNPVRGLGATPPFPDSPLCPLVGFPVAESNTPSRWHRHHPALASPSKPAPPAKASTLQNSLVSPLKHFGRAGASPDARRQSHRDSVSATETPARATTPDVRSNGFALLGARPGGFGIVRPLLEHGIHCKELEADDMRGNCSHGVCSPAQI